jgi:hypothetical protein
VPNPIPINVAPAARANGSTLQTATVNNPGGFVTWSGTLTGLGSGAGSDYENPANALDIGIYYEDPLHAGQYILYAGFHWQGGPLVLHGVTDPPPPFSFGLGNLPVGNVRVQFAFTGNYTVGLTSTLA